ncbi:unnamed protein product [Parnassius apollo]|uniref:(apollo) hypothetical protein n=1 Tax=Parnassius apollo TaxID=110799 RepID=A0A8S3W2N9_PARAO|nr:unnamed protein product [Parnassius apollo]
MADLRTSPLPDDVSFTKNRYYKTIIRTPLTTKYSITSFNILQKIHLSCCNATYCSTRRATFTAQCGAHRASGAGPAAARRTAARGAPPSRHSVVLTGRLALVPLQRDVLQLEARHLHGTVWCSPGDWRWSRCSATYCSSRRATFTAQCGAHRATGAGPAAARRTAARGAPPSRHNAVLTGRVTLVPLQRVVLQLEARHLHGTVWCSPGDWRWSRCSATYCSSRRATFTAQCGAHRATGAGPAAARRTAARGAPPSRHSVVLTGRVALVPLQRDVLQLEARHLHGTVWCSPGDWRWSRCSATYCSSRRATFTAQCGAHRATGAGPAAARRTAARGAPPSRHSVVLTGRLALVPLQRDVLQLEARHLHGTVRCSPGDWRWSRCSATYCSSRRATFTAQCGAHRATGAGPAAARRTAARGAPPSRHSAVLTGRLALVPLQRDVLPHEARHLHGTVRCSPGDWRWSRCSATYCSSRRATFTAQCGAHRTTGAGPAAARRTAARGAPPSRHSAVLTGRLALVPLQRDVLQLEARHLHGTVRCSPGDWRWSRCSATYCRTRRATFTAQCGAHRETGAGPAAARRTAARGAPPSRHSAVLTGRVTLVPLQRDVMQLEARHLATFTAQCGAHRATGAGPAAARRTAARGAPPSRHSVVLTGRLALVPLQRDVLPHEVRHLHATVRCSPGEWRWSRCSATYCRTRRATFTAQCGAHRASGAGPAAARRTAARGTPPSRHSAVLTERVPLAPLQRDVLPLEARHLHGTVRCSPSECRWSRCSVTYCRTRRATFTAQCGAHRASGAGPAAARRTAARGAPPLRHSAVLTE